MIEVTRDRFIAAPPDAVWLLIAAVERLPEWFGLTERAEVLEGEGLGRRQRVYGRWSNKRSEVDQVVTEFEPGRVLTWRHEAERLDGRPAPQFARETKFTIALEPQAAGTLVRLVSRQQPAGFWRGLALRLIGARQVAKHMERSLDRLVAEFRAEDGS